MLGSLDKPEILRTDCRRDHGSNLRCASSPLDSALYFPVVSACLIFRQTNTTAAINITRATASQFTRRSVR